MDQGYYPQHIKMITMDEFISFFGIEGVPLQNLQLIRQLKDQALSHNPDVSHQAFEDLMRLYRSAKMTLALIKSDPANIIRILKSKQLDLSNFLGNPNDN